MAKIKNLFPETKQVKSLIFTERKDKKDGNTHNVRVKRLKPKKK